MIRNTKMAIKSFPNIGNNIQIKAGKAREMDPQGIRQYTSIAPKREQSKCLSEKENLAFSYKEAATTSTMTKPCDGAPEQLCETKWTRTQACITENHTKETWQKAEYQT